MMVSYSQSHHFCHHLVPVYLFLATKERMAGSAHHIVLVS